eukprot:3366300-Pyramimonas_sp.AAC.1
MGLAPQWCTQRYLGCRRHTHRTLHWKCCGASAAMSVSSPKATWVVRASFHCSPMSARASN